MAKNLLPILFLLTILLPQSSPNSPPSTLCKSTPYPSFCNSILPSSNSSSNLYDYTRFSIHKSLSAARKFHSLIQKYLHKPKYLTVSAIRALEDCKSLAENNIEFLTSTSQTVSQKITLGSSAAGEIQTVLSAILTNIETCVDGLRGAAPAWRVKNGVLAPLANDTRLYSVSLALFTKGWVRKRKKNRGFVGAKKDGSLNLKMSTRNQAVFEALSSRKALQSGDGNNHVLVSDIVIVSQDGSGNFTWVNDAVAAAPKNSDGTSGYFLIYIRAGVYEENVRIAKDHKYLMMIGDGIDKTIITGNRSFVDGWTTFNSATFAVAGTGFVAVNMTFRNTAGAIKHQAVALRNGADLSTFYHCSFQSYQDTLYAHSFRQFYRECNIYGTVDFIFGNAAAVFQGCNLFARLPMANQFNAITAQGRTDPNQNTGISIQNCSIRAADDLARSNITIQTYLGRPWKAYSRTVYMKSFMGSLINPTGWSVWSGDFALNTSYYAEFDNSGPGSNTALRVTWPAFHIVNATDAVNFTASALLLGDGWLPRTGVPYTGGLL